MVNQTYAAVPLLVIATNDYIDARLGIWGNIEIYRKFL
jgi:hypothetical protein